MIRELDRVVLTAPIPAEGLGAGDVGTVVHAYEDAAAFEVEVVALDGRTVAVVTVDEASVRPVGASEIAHARAINSPDKD